MIDLKEELKVDRKTLITYIVIYFSWGFGMNEFGKWVGIAEFTYWWQIITCYILYMIPISLVLRKYSWFEQYSFGLVAMGLLEFMGYWLGTSIAHDNNLVDQFFGIRNFSLGMALFFASYFPLGNALVGKVSRLLR